MTTDDLRFKEIEHKFVVDERFDLSRLGDALAALHPTRTHEIEVRDRYFLTADGRRRRYVIRHRYDTEIHHLTMKTLEPDSEVRVEVNLDLGHHKGDQSAQVDAFVEQLGVEWRGTLHKHLRVWDFSDCEVVYYEASTESRVVRCVEFEATEKQSVDAALAILEKYESTTGFSDRTRSRVSLLQLVFPEALE